MGIEKRKEMEYNKTRTYGWVLAELAFCWISN